ncbi:hypothetical protein [Kitasatospora sp. NPDC093558]|uniref:hypothetical protein n=1 Tax=Kitasatospora sp. NPDC093558 TaxID=3155201 RepID=UPI0034490ECF
MNKLVQKARWVGALAAVTALLATGGGVAVAAPAAPAPVQIALGGKALGFTVSPDGTKAYVLVNHRVSATDMMSTVRIVDTRTGAVTHLLTTNALNIVRTPVVSPDGKRLYVIVGRDVLTMDLTTGAEIARATAPEQPRDPEGLNESMLTGATVSADGTRLYVNQYGPFAPRLGSGPGRVLTFDTTANRFLGATELTGFTVDRVNPVPGTTDAYVGTADSVHHLDVGSDEPAIVGTVAGIDYGDELAVSPDATKVYALGHRASTGAVLRIDPQEDTASTAFTVEPNLEDLHLVSASPDSRRLYLLRDGKTPKAAVLSYDTATNAAVPGETLTGFGLDSVTSTVLGRDGHTLYLAGDKGDASYLEAVAL